MGKFDKEGITFDDVLLIPQKSEVLPHQVDLSTNLTKQVSSTGTSLSLSGQKEETATYNGSNNNYLKKLSIHQIHYI